MQPATVSITCSLSSCYLPFRSCETLLGPYLLTSRLLGKANAGALCSYILEPKMLEPSCPLDNGRHDAGIDRALANISSLGSLSKLPLEILQEILSNSTLSTLTECRTVNRGLRLAVNSLPHYKAIFTFAPNSLRAALSIEVAAYITCNDLYDVLCTKECNTCGKFGAVSNSLRNFVS